MKDIDIIDKSDKDITSDLDQFHNYYGYTKRYGCIVDDGGKVVIFVPGKERIWLYNWVDRVITWVHCATVPEIIDVRLKYINNLIKYFYWGPGKNER